MTTSKMKKDTSGADVAVDVTASPSPTMTADDIGSDVVDSPAFTEGGFPDTVPDEAHSEDEDHHPENSIASAPAVPSDAIALDSFLTSKFGKHVDQAAGFTFYARKLGLQRMVRESWEEHFAAFESTAPKG